MRDRFRFQARRLVAAAALAALAACGSMTTFYPSPPGAAIRGTGGPSTTVDGYPVWAHGATPLRPHTRVGEVEIRDNNSDRGVARINEALAGVIRETKGSGAIALVPSQRNASQFIAGNLEPRLANIVERYAIIRFAD